MDSIKLHDEGHRNEVRRIWDTYIFLIQPFESLDILSDNFTSNYLEK